jgi:phage terminase large subunit
MPKEVKINSKTIPVFVPVLVDDENEIKAGKREFVLVSGRIGGKTQIILDKMKTNLFNYKKLDIVVLRANSSAMKESIFLEFKQKMLKELPPELFLMFEWKETPPMLITSPFGNQIRFSGVGLGSKSGSNTSKGKVAERNISLIVSEETQECMTGTGTSDLLKNAIATYIRLLDDKVGKIIYAGNADRNKLGKFNIWVDEMRKDKNVTVIETSFRDIWHLLNNATKQVIIREYEMNPKNACYLYGGEPIGGNDLVYGSFTETIHMLPPSVFEPLFATNEENLKNINQVYIGVDGATSKDKMILFPIFHFKNTRLVGRTAEMIYHDPLKNGIINNARLVKEYIKPWLRDLIFKYSLQNKKITFVVDGHSVDLIDNLIYELYPFGRNITIFKFTRKDHMETTKTVNNAFGEKKLFFTEENWHELGSSYTNHGAEVHVSVLIREYMTVCWLEEDSTKFNDSIPNDISDAVRYPVCYHANPYQLQDFTKKGGE